MGAIGGKTGKESGRGGLKRIRAFATVQKVLVIGERRCCRMAVRALHIGFRFRSQNTMFALKENQ